MSDLHISQAYLDHQWDAINEKPMSTHDKAMVLAHLVENMIIQRVEAHAAHQKQVLRIRLVELGLIDGVG